METVTISTKDIPFIAEGTEHYASGIKDNKGRDCGSSVYYGVYTETGLLSAYVYSNRDGRPFCSNSGSLGKFKTESERAAWVALKVQQAKDRAAKKWADFN